MSGEMGNMWSRWRTLAVTLLFGLPCAPEAAEVVVPEVRAGLRTRWADEVAPDRVHPEYPRPQMVRDQWVNLNGLWDYAIRTAAEPEPEAYDGKILVPFPVESLLSGVGRSLDENATLWYRRSFTLPAGWRGKRIQLHFGAVDWEATVTVNGRRAGIHRGGYDPFSVDITDHLEWKEEEDVVVAVRDATGGIQPRGKQSLRPQGIFYTRVSGVWQTVWLEPMHTDGIRQLRLTPDVPGKALHVEVFTHDPGDKHKVELRVLARGKQVARQHGISDRRLTVKIPQPHLWRPEDPFLYDLKVVLREGQRVLDKVDSYFGMRRLGVAPDGQGRMRLELNGKPYFQVGVLDQGYWPDGLYTAPSDAALRHDIETAKQLGYNALRKHVKVEPARWYYWCDRLGILVWQDMPSGGNTDPAARRQFEGELRRIMEALRNHPSVAMWILFNEGWGQYDTDRLAASVRKRDPTRWVNSASGWTDFKVGDVVDQHDYPGPPTPRPDANRAAVVGEFGGLGLFLPDHMWSETAWSYQEVSDGDWLAVHYASLLEGLRKHAQQQGLSGAIYTQLTDVETEGNGLQTYDRAMVKVDAYDLAALNLGDRLQSRSSVVVPNALQGPNPWRYTFSDPGVGWADTAFDDSTWNRGPGGFGKDFTKGSVVRTTWDSTHIWLRREVTLPDPVPGDLAFHLHHDENAEVFINGVPAASLRGFVTRYTDVELPPQATAALRSGPNLLAVHCVNTFAGQYIDVGLRSLRLTRSREPAAAGL